MTDANLVTGQGTTYNLPNYTGDLFLASPTATPFLSSIGGLTGYRTTNAPRFSWQGYDLRDAAVNNAVSEGATAGAGTARKRYHFENVTEEHLSVVDVSYTRQGSTGLLAADATPVLGVQPVTSELDFQVQAELKAIARDYERSFIEGVKHIAVDSTDQNKTDGILSAIDTNVITNTTPVDLSKDIVDELVQAVFDNGGVDDPEGLTIAVGSRQKRALTKAYLAAGNYRESSRTVGGVNYQTIETDFGTLNVMLNRWIPADTLAVINLAQCRPVGLEVPGKGNFFLEPLAKVGASERYQIWGNLGLEWGNEKCHAKATGLA